MVSQAIQKDDPGRVAFSTECKNGILKNESYIDLFFGGGGWSNMVFVTNILYYDFKNRWRESASAVEIFKRREVKLRSVVGTCRQTHFISIQDGHPTIVHFCPRAARIAFQRFACVPYK